jgi:hypothetical protein
LYKHPKIYVAWGKNKSLGANHGKALPLLKSPPSWPPHEMKQLKKPNLLGWD